MPPRAPYPAHQNLGPPALILLPLSLLLAARLQDEQMMMMIVPTELRQSLFEGDRPWELCACASMEGGCLKKALDTLVIHVIPKLFLLWSACALRIWDPNCTEPFGTAHVARRMVIELSEEALS